jgi:hypothetical protein
MPNLLFTLYHNSKIGIYNRKQIKSFVFFNNNRKTSHLEFVPSCFDFLYLNCSNSYMGIKDIKQDATF